MPHDHIIGSNLELIEIICQLLTKHWVLIGLRAQSRLTCCYQDRVVLKAVNANLAYFALIKFCVVLVYSNTIEKASNI